jgi:hypothetical protein
MLFTPMSETEIDLFGTNDNDNDNDVSVALLHGLEMA